MRITKARKTISPVTHSNWVAPIVPIVSNQDLWALYRVTVNQAIKIDSYLLPRIS